MLINYFSSERAPLQYPYIHSPLPAYSVTFGDLDVSYNDKIILWNLLLNKSKQTEAFVQKATLISC